MAQETSFHTDEQDVAVPATREQLFGGVETLAIEALIQAKPLNTTNILVFDRLVGGVQGVEIAPGDAFPLSALSEMDLVDLSCIFIDTITADDKVLITWRD